MVKDKQHFITHFKGSIVLKRENAISGHVCLFLIAIVLYCYECFINVLTVFIKLGQAYNFLFLKRATY